MQAGMVDIIEKKKQGGKLSAEEIRYFVEGYTVGEIPDYQAAALLMAICFQKMDREETFVLADTMKRSGDTVDLSGIGGIKVDKHSTGGVGDKTTFVVGPLAAACGVPVAKMSGRGLGFTGGTVDKMEAIPGFRTAMEAADFMALVNRVGLSVIGQTAHIAPADKKLYALRDVTATVMNPSLIAGSIMSKKLASGSDAIVLDVKCGGGSFNSTVEEARELARLMVDIGKADGKRVLAVITDMDQPLGKAVGNSIEVEEAIETLKGRGPADITELSVALAGYMIYAGEKAVSPEAGMAQARQALESGAALEKLRLFIEGQGGEPEVVEDYSIFPQAACSVEVLAPAAGFAEAGRRDGKAAALPVGKAAALPVGKAAARPDKDGFVAAIDARAIGLASQHSGAGRETKEDTIDLAAGILLNKKVGDPVKAGERLATVFSSSKEKAARAAAEVAAAYHFSETPPERSPLIKDVIL